MSLSMRFCQVNQRLTCSDEEQVSETVPLEGAHRAIFAVCEVIGSKGLAQS